MDGLTTIAAAVDNPAVTAVGSNMALIATASPFPASGSRSLRDFYIRTRDAKKILLMDMGRLGDVIHMLPALHLVRQNYPQAQLHVLIGYQELLKKLTPWVDVAWPPIQQVFARNFGLIRKLRKQKFDAIIVLHPDDCALFVAWFAGAPQLLARRYLPTRPWWWQPLLLNEVADISWDSDPIFVQKFNVLRQAGLRSDRLALDVRCESSWLDECGIPTGDRKTYIHYAPFTSIAAKDLMPAQHIEILRGLASIHPRIVLSCDGSAGQKSALDRLISQLPFTPWRVFKGSLEIHQFIALIGGAKLHVGGDSGGLQVARLLDTASISWLRKPRSVRDIWEPVATETLHRVLYAQHARENCIEGVSTEDILAIARADMQV